MKGIIFKEFLIMVEDKFGYEMVDNIITDSKLPNDGAYTSVGTYPHTEIVALVSNLSKYSKISVPQLLGIYGEHAFGIFAIAYANMINQYHTAFEFLSHVEDTIHVEVLKLYPEAELPSLKTIEKNSNKMIMHYQSTRAMSDFAIGLMNGCLNHFKESATITKLPLKEDQTEVQFTLTINV
ncbi:MAG: heme NO-binding domain-containing protein [Prolixibacteraceae bacterium]